MTKLKICFLLPDNQGGSGGVLSVMEHCRRFVQKGHEATVAFLAPQARTDRTFYAADGVGLARIDELGEERFDVALSTWWGTAYHVGRIPARTYASYIQGDEANFYQAPLRAQRLLVEQTLEERFNFFVVSGWLRDQLRIRHGQEATVVRYGLEAERFLQAEPCLPPGERTRVLLEGPPDNWLKRLPLAFEVVDAFPELEVVYLSPGGKPKPNWRVDHFYEAVDHREVPEIYTSCDFILKFSTTESFAFPVAEMFACGGTAVVTGFGGHDEYIHHERNALVVPIDDKPAMLAAVRRLVDDPALLGRLKGEAARAHERMSWADSNDVFEARLLEIADAGPDRLPLLEATLPAMTQHESLVSARTKGHEEVHAAHQELLALKDSRAFRLGRALLWPARLLRGGD